MNVKLYCHHCETFYDVERNDLDTVLLHDPAHLICANHVFSYSGGCFFKTLARLKRAAASTKHRRPHDRTDTPMA